MSPIQGQSPYNPYDDQDNQSSDIAESRAASKKKSKNEAKSPTGIFLFVFCFFFQNIPWKILKNIFQNLPQNILKKNLPNIDFISKSSVVYFKKHFSKSSREYFDKKQWCGLLLHYVFMLIICSPDICI